MTEQSGDFGAGVLTGRVAALETRMDRHETFMSEKLQDVVRKLEENGNVIASARGGIRVLLWLIGLGAFGPTLILLMKGTH